MAMTPTNPKRPRFGFEKAIATHTRARTHRAIVRNRLRASRSPAALRHQTNEIKHETANTPTSVILSNNVVFINRLIDVKLLFRSGGEKEQLVFGGASFRR